MSLRDYGWNDFFENAFKNLNDPKLQPARVLLSGSGVFGLAGEAGDLSGSLAGRLRHLADNVAEIPAIGDWVAVSADSGGAARIENLLPRRTKLSRQVAGRRSEEQVVAANVDLVLIVMGLDGDYNLRRLERFLSTVWDSGARPAVLLNKSDLCDDADTRRAEVQRTAPGVPVLLSSLAEDRGVDAVREQLRARETAVLVGSSGVGKSTLINRLLGAQVQKTREVRSGDGRGRHATTHRELFRLAQGALLIDNPGIRELQLWADESSLAHSFPDIDALAETCRFRDCSHRTEAGCAVLEAARNGTLDPARLQNYHSLQKELRYLELRQNESAQRLQKKKWRAIHKEMRRSGRHRRH